MQELIEHYDTEKDVLDGEITFKPVSGPTYHHTLDGAAALIEKYNNFALKVENLKLRDVGEMRPLLDVSLLSTFGRLNIWLMRIIQGPASYCSPRGTKTRPLARASP